MNLLFLNSRTFPATGGVETHMRQLVQHLSPRHHITVVGQCVDDRPMNLWNYTVGTPGFDPFQEGSAHVKPLLPSLWGRLMMLPILLRQVKGIRKFFYVPVKWGTYPCFRAAFRSQMRVYVRKADVIHAFGGDYMGRLALEVAHQCGKPFVLTPFVHPGWWGDEQQNLEIFRAADAVVALLRAEADFYLRNGVAREKVHVIGVAAPPEPQRKAQSFREQHGVRGRMVLFVAAKRPYKGFLDLLAATPQVWKAHPDVTFAFVGPRSPESEAAFKQVSDPRIVEVGKVSEEEKAAALRDCDVLCLPSRSEILPTVVLEAWRAKKPVVVSDIPTCVELVENGRCGLAVRAGSANLAQAIMNLLGSNGGAAAMGEAGWEKWQRHFTLEVVARAHERLYSQLAQ